MLAKIEPLGRQLREARLRKQLRVEDLAAKARVSAAAIYNVERYDRGSRARTVIKLARALGLKLRLPDLRKLATDRGFTEVKLAQTAGLAFDTVRSLLARPLGGNVRSLERLCAVLGLPLLLVI